MALRNGICPNCGAQQTVETSLRAAVCTVCKTEYVVEDAFSNGSAKEYLDRAKAYLKAGQLNKAKLFYYEAYALDPAYILNPSNEEFREELNFRYGFPYHCNLEQYCKKHPNIEPYEREYVEKVRYRSGLSETHDMKRQREQYFSFFFKGIDISAIRSQCISRCDLVCQILGGLPDFYKNNAAPCLDMGMGVFFEWRDSQTVKPISSLDKMEYLFSRDTKK